MGTVIALVRVYPSEEVSSLESLVSRISESLPPSYRVLRSESLEIAYGYKALVLHISFPEDTEGGTEDLESRLSAVEGVSSVEVEAITRALF